MKPIKPKKLFLIDAIGALVSSTVIGLGAFYLKDILGMPQKVLSLLAFIPILYFFYSLAYYFKASKNENLGNQLKTIAFANLSYCVLTLTLLLFYFSELTALELTYFILEIIVLIILSKVELQTAKK